MGYGYLKEGYMFIYYQNHQEKINNEIGFKTLKQKLDNAIMIGKNKQK